VARLNVFLLDRQPVSRRLDNFPVFSLRGQFTAKWQVSFSLHSAVLVDIARLSGRSACDVSNDVIIDWPVRLSVYSTVLVDFVRRRVAGELVTLSMTPRF
jgi:hypothetical protein